LAGNRGQRDPGADGIELGWAPEARASHGAEGGFRRAGGGCPDAVKGMGAIRGGCWSFPREDFRGSWLHFRGLGVSRPCNRSQRPPPADLSEEIGNPRSKSFVAEVSAGLVRTTGRQIWQSRPYTRGTRLRVATNPIARRYGPNVFPFSSLASTITSSPRFITYVPANNAPARSRDIGAAGPVFVSATQLMTKPLNNSSHPYWSFQCLFTLWRIIARSLTA